MKKHQIITLVFLIWTLVVACQIQDKLGPMIFTTYQQHVANTWPAWFQSPSQEPCDESPNTKGRSVLVKGSEVVFLQAVRYLSR